MILRGMCKLCCYSLEVKTYMYFMCITKHSVDWICTHTATSIPLYDIILRIASRDAWFTSVVIRLHQHREYRCQQCPKYQRVDVDVDIYLQSVIKHLIFFPVDNATVIFRHQSTDLNRAQTFWKRGQFTRRLLP